jgi:hypothetical protein
VTAGVWRALSEDTGFSVSALSIETRIQFTHTLNTYLTRSTDETSTSRVDTDAIETDLIEPTRDLSTTKDALTLSTKALITTIDACTRVINTEVELAASPLWTPRCFAGIRETLATDTDLTFATVNPHAKVSTSACLGGTGLPLYAINPCTIRHTGPLLTEVPLRTSKAGRDIPLAWRSTLA